MEKKELINLTIINDSDCTLTIPLFKNNVASINASTKYQWDITSAIGVNTYIYTIDDTNVYGDLDLCTGSITNILCGLGSIVVNGVSITITYTPTLVGLLNSLNALGYGFFCTEFTTSITTTTTSTTSTTTTAAPTTSTTTTSTTPIPTTTTSTTSTTTTEAPTTTTTSTTTTSTTTEPPTTTTTTSTTSTTTTEAPTTTSTTTTTTTAAITCNNYQIEGAPSIDVEWIECDGTTNSDTVTTAIIVCAQTGSVVQTGGAGNIVQLGICSVSPTTTSTTTTTTTINAVFSCGTTDSGFDTSAIFDLGTTSGLVTITGSGLNTGDTYDIIYPVGGSTIHTTVPVDGSGNLSDTFYWTYDSVNSNAEITLILP